ncbi:MAG: nicotinate-nucleotide--dimethylbenzimidazole phosphoribosyltransferase [Geobacteraceae bacterium GWC2_55_20]|nr:MAG: nicotinate-nucleotide--dimethylbenzimidazole phosphoribosyltransferase [Geobacteraceae bacterium GWC2_55_20]OGU24782.1 MAG: nicotinate-nucleotide--dimethylbenzimidazole phosphoribosyltransferase [Geobacteraceae bacterium GWF2_54_21]HBA71110.1 nicotinate-nucleotide--dimethylbenzimidazole phosphoribosyltransferase [Geobacter sp.]HCE68715.1 nicotinate-nucleotide--dimethylbenzimidazole phosphoribosyltransferase [Geobacter sp.]
MDIITNTLNRIKPVSVELLQQAQSRLDNKTKPPGSLGRLEEFARRLVAISGVSDPDLSRKVIFTFAADHGIVQEGVSLYPSEVTRQMVLNFLAGGAGVNVLARHAGAEVRVVDVGVDHDFENVPGLIHRKVARGTRNFAKGPAMSREETLAALKVGIDLADQCRVEGIGLVGTGEMGIGNTTPSSAIIGAISGKTVAEVTHRGTGISDIALLNKIRVIKEGLEVNRPDGNDPLDVLAKVGGLEIAAIAGLVLGGAANSIPVVIDGFISTAGALIASELHPHVRDYIFAAHQSVEIGHRFMLERIGAEPILDLNLRLGEGTGAALAMTLIEAGVKILKEMATFEQAGVTH